MINNFHLSMIHIILILSIGFNNVVHAAGPEAVECMVQEEQSDCLKFLKREECIQPVAECMRKHPYFWGR